MFHRHTNEVDLQAHARIAAVISIVSRRTQRKQRARSRFLRLPADKFSVIRANELERHAEKRSARKKQRTKMNSAPPLRSGAALAIAQARRSATHDRRCRARLFASCQPPAFKKSRPVIRRLIRGLAAGGRRDLPRSRGAEKIYQLCETGPLLRGKKGKDL